jgi:hypothetical protein
MPAACPPRELIFPETFEAILRQRSVPRGVLDIPVSQVGLQCARIVAVIRELVTTGVAKHVRMSLDSQPSDNRRPLDHAGEAGRRKRCSALRDEHKRRLRALPLMTPQGPELAAG